MSLVELWREAARRRVLRAAALYAVVAWVIIQVAATVQPYLKLPEWTVTLVIVLLALGFPVALVLAWVFQITPDRVQHRISSAPSVRIGRWFTPTLVVVGLVIGGWLAYSRSAISLDRGSIAVLPFTNLSADPSNEYFAAGVHDQLLSELNRIDQLKVISRTSVMQYNGSDRNLREIGRALGVRSILEGSVQRDGDRIRIIAQLIDAGTDRHLWSETYDRAITDLFAVQSDIAQSIAEALRTELTPDDRAQLAAVPTRNTAAYDIFLRAQHHPAVTVSQLYEKAALYKQAIARDSLFALAHIRLAHTLFDLVDVMFEWQLLPQADSAVQRAIQLSPSSADAMLLRARARWRVGDYDGAFADAALAREREPGNADALRQFGSYLLHRGFSAEAERVLEQVVQLDPANSAAYVSLAHTYAAQERWGEAEASISRALQLAPDDAYLRWVALRIRIATAEKLEDLAPWLDEGVRRHGATRFSQMMTRGSGETAVYTLALRPAFFDSLTLAPAVDSVDYFLVRGLAAQSKGNMAEARAAFEMDRRIGLARVAARTQGDLRMRNPGTVAWAHSDLALALAALGQAEEAIAAARRATELLPLGSPNPAWIDQLWILARVYTMTNRPDDAVNTLKQLLPSPLARMRGFTLQRVRIDPMFASLRGKL